MRLIDADALNVPHFHLATDKIKVLDMIDEAPTIDIVRCDECKWRKAKMMPKSVKCLFSGKADDFCSYGEREGE